MDSQSMQDYRDDEDRAEYERLKRKFEPAIAEQAKGQAAPVLAVKTLKPYYVLNGFSGDIDLYTFAQMQDCAEEARQEERQQWDLTCSAQALEIEYLKEQLAQRTAGGDAETAIRAGFESGDWVDHDLGGTITLHYESPPEAKAAFEAIHSIIRAQPVAEAAAQAKPKEAEDTNSTVCAKLPNGACVTNVYEAFEEGRKAAAQADDVAAIACGDCGLTMAESRLLHDLKRGAAAAPTAQPTPKTPEIEGIAEQPTLTEYIANARGDVPAWKDCWAQPTPPDDERRARIQAKLLAMPDGPDVIGGGSFKPLVDSVFEAAWKTDGEGLHHKGIARHWFEKGAVLRQPGALPEEPQSLREAVYMALHYYMKVQNPDEWAAADAAIAAMRKAGALPDWIKLDGDTTIIHGVRYSNRLLEDFGKTLPVGQPLLIESREQDGALCVVMLDWAVVDGPGALPDGAEDAARWRYVKSTTTAIRNPDTGERIACTPEQFEKSVDAARAAADTKAPK